MVKKPKKTEKIGLRKPRVLDNFPSSKVQKWKKKLQGILTNDLTDEKNHKKNQFLLDYSLKVCQFRLAVIDSRDTQPSFRQIDRMVHRAHSLGFSQEDLWAINRVFRDQDKCELKNFQEFQDKKGVK